MKRVFSLFLFFSAFHAQANDTLTRAQVYNFNVGDTFDYRVASVWSSGTNGAYTVTFERDIVVNQWYDSVFHLLHIARFIHSTDTTVADKMDTFVLSNPTGYVLMDTNIGGGYMVPGSNYIDSNSIYHGRLLNGDDQIWGLAATDQAGYAQGLGKVYAYMHIFDPDSPSEWDSVYLIYYAKGPEIWGTPYYIADGKDLLHFTPLPETCAVWTDNFSQAFISLEEQIRTGNNIPFHGHSYIELIYRAYDYGANISTTDSLIGYFRNDTIGKQILFLPYIVRYLLFCLQFQSID